MVFCDGPSLDPVTAAASVVCVCESREASAAALVPHNGAHRTRALISPDGRSLKYLDDFVVLALAVRPRLLELHRVAFPRLELIVGHELRVPHDAHL